MKLPLLNPKKSFLPHDPTQVWTYLQFFAAVVVLLMLIIGGLLLALNRQISTLRVNGRADNLQIADIGLLAKYASDLDSGQRGYFLTGSKKYLQPYDEAVDGIPAVLHSIEGRLQTDNDRVLFNSARQSLENKQIELQQSLNIDRTAGHEAALDYVRRDVGQALMDDVRGDIERLRSSVSMRAQMRTQHVNGLLDARDGLLTSLILVAFLVSLATFYLLRTQIQALRTAQDERDRADAANLANREKSTFLANMSHEIRTPMNAIFGFAQLLKDTVKNDREKFYVQAITQSGQVLLGLINDILDMSKIEAGKLELQAQPTDLRELFRSSETLFSHMGAEKGLLMKVDLPEHLPVKVMVDPLRLRQVIINLIGNAMKYTETGSVVTTVSTQPDDSRHLTLTIAVTDTGIGIPENKQKKIFEPFIQLNNGGLSAPGAGLGLSIVKRIVELMNGSIHVASAPGKGATFTVELPHLPIDMSPALQGSVEPSTAPLRPLKIVVVDDVELNRRLIEGLFIDSQHQVLLADGGLSGVAMATREVPDVVLMDIRMPDIDGVEALRRIRLVPELAKTKVIAATASSMLGEEGRLRKQFDGYLRKPITREMLDGELRRFFFTELEVGPGTALLPVAADLLLQPAALSRWRSELPELCEFVTRAARTMSSDDVTALVAHMQKLAAEDHFGNLLARAGEISNAAAVFDIVSLERHIKQMQQLCDELLEK